MSVEYLPSPRPGNLNQCIFSYSIFFTRSLTYSLGLFLQIVVQNFSLPQRIASFIFENVKNILVSENQFDLELCWVIKVCSNFLDILEGTLWIGCAFF